MSSLSGNVLLEPRYRPFWLLGVVVLGIVIYAVYWFGRLGEFKATMEAMTNGNGPVSVAAEDVSYGGFPYRLSATFKNVTVTRHGLDYTLTVKAEELAIERQPWKRALHLGFFRNPTLTLTAPTVLDGVRLEGAGTEGRFSLFLRGGGVERLSAVLDDARIEGAPWLQTPLTAAKLELHGREVAALRGRQAQPLPQPQPGTEDAEGPGVDPTPPVFLEVLVNGAQVRWGQGEPLTLMASFGVTGEPKAADVTTSFVEAWREAAGTVEVYSFNMTTVADKSDMVIARATFALDEQNRLLAGGTITTPCPAMIAGLFGQQLEDMPSVRVQGLIALPFQAQNGEFTLQQPQTEWPSPARNQDAGCPDLRR